MGHFCEDCGQACYCDGEDLMWPQPNNCVHFTKATECGDDMDSDCLDDEDGDVDQDGPRRPIAKSGEEGGTNVGS